MAELTQIMVANTQMKPTPRAGEGPFEVRFKIWEDLPRGDKKGKQVESNTEVESQSDSRSMASSKHRASPSQIHSCVDLRESLNAKKNRDGDLWAKLLAKATSTAKNLPTKSIAERARSIPREKI